jgi:hypothetical protein
MEGEKEYFKLSKKSLDWLVKNRSPYFRNYCWGLPFEYVCVPQSGPYLITTSFCAEAFLDFFEHTKKKKYMGVAKSAVKWIFCELGGERFNNGFILYYSPYDCLKYFIPNAVSIALGFLTKMGKYLDWIQEIVGSIAEAIVNFQNSDGAWHYSTKRKVIDNLHTAYTLEGLWKYYHLTKDQQVLVPLIKGTEYFLKHFYKKGYGKQIVLYDFPYSLNPRDINGISIVDAMKDFAFSTAIRFGIYNRETELWGYAAAIRAFVEASYYDPKYLSIAIKIFDYLKNRLLSQGGYFYYRGSDDSCFIRHQSHIFEALGILCRRLKE